jgi:transcriptional regulator with XRE-family HTH domain
MSPTPEHLIKTRKACKLSQGDMAGFMGMGRSAYADLENGKSTVRGIHVAAADRVSLLMAVVNRDPMMASAMIRKEALKLAEMITSQPPK